MREAKDDRGIKSTCRNSKSFLLAMCSQASYLGLGHGLCSLPFNQRKSKLHRTHSITITILLLMIVTTVNASSLRNMRGFNPNRPNPSADHAQSSCSLTPQSQDGTDFLDLSLIRLFLSGMQPPIDTSTLLMTMSEVAFIYLMIRTNYSSQVITTESRMAILIPTCNSISSRSRAPR